MVPAIEANAAAFLAVVLLGVSAILLAVSLLSWQRLRHARLLFVASAFAVLAVKGALGVLAAARGEAGSLALAGLDVATVLLLYGTVAAR